uniref:Alginate_lyase domain-containing protein n=1 Tax=Macrostomum lignano TaxID=282301 RepID=A0A1I8F544_9PLAT
MLSEFDNRCATRVELLNKMPVKGTCKAAPLVLLLLLSLQLAQAAPSRPRDAAYRYAPSEADLAVPNGSYHPAEQANFNVAEWKRSGSNDFNAARLLAKLADFKAKNDFLTPADSHGLKMEPSKPEKEPSAAREAFVLEIDH